MRETGQISLGKHLEEISFSQRKFPALLDIPQRELQQGTANGRAHIPIDGQNCIPQPPQFLRGTSRPLGNSFII